MSELGSLGPLDARGVVSAATGNVAAVYGLDAGRLEIGRPADLALIDVPVGSSAGDAFAALELGDVPAVACVVTGGCLSFAKS
ncbi:MAG: amidohydrolase family protein [Actinomycetia bacterium]|nr:amidohydrolase family protein [Actinomycetes bacterium]